MSVLEGNMTFANGIHPLGEGHAAAGRHQPVATLHGRGVAARVGFNLLIILEGFILEGCVLCEGVLRNRVLREGSLSNGVIQREGNIQGFRSLRRISRIRLSGFSRICRLRETLILVAEDARRANRGHIKTGGRHQRQLRGNIQQLQHRLQRQGIARIAQVRVQAATGNGVSLHTKHRHDISDALLDLILIGTENLRTRQLRGATGKLREQILQHPAKTCDFLTAEGTVQALRHALPGELLHDVLVGFTERLQVPFLIRVGFAGGLLIDHQVLLVRVALSNQGVAVQQAQQRHQIHRVGRNEGPFPRRRGNNLPSTGRKVCQKKPRNHVNGQVNEHGGVAVHQELQLTLSAGQLLPHGRLTLEGGTGHRQLIHQLRHVILNGSTHVQVAVGDLQHVHVALIIHGAQHVELHLMLTHLVGDQLRGGGGRLNEGGNQLLIGGGASHDAAALNLLLQLHGLLDALIALLLGGVLLILGAQVLGAIRFAGSGGCGGVVPHAGELIDGPLFALQGDGEAVNLRAVVPGALLIGVFRLHLLVHATGFTNEVQDGCGNVVNGGVVALTGVDEVARQFGGMLPVLEGDTRPDGGVPGKDARIIVEAAHKIIRKVVCKIA